MQLTLATLNVMLLFYPICTWATYTHTPLNYNGDYTMLFCMHIYVYIFMYNVHVHNEYYYYDLPRLKQQGSFKKVNSFPVVQVTSLLPLLRAPESEQVTSTTVPGSTGNLAAVSIVLISPVHITVKILPLIICYKKF